MTYASFKAGMCKISVFLHTDCGRIQKRERHFCAFWRRKNIIFVSRRSSVGGESVKRVVCGGGIGDSWWRNSRWVVEGIAKV